MRIRLRDDSRLSGSNVINRAYRFTKAENYLARSTILSGSYIETINISARYYWSSGDYVSKLYFKLFKGNNNIIV